MWKNIAVVLVAAALLLPAERASALENDDLLAMVAMPLAVAAVSQLADVPVNDLIDVVTLLNNAAVPPAQFVEVVRYAPVALVYEADGPTFVDYVRLREQEGLRGLQLVNAIDSQMDVYGLRDVDFNEPRTRVIEIVDRDEFIPPIVRTRVVEWRSSHPHGGPPGQLKKQLGMQTGAEVVHGMKPGRDHDDRDSRGSVGRGDDHPKSKQMKSKDKGNKGGHGKGHGKGKGK